MYSRIKSIIAAYETIDIFNKRAMRISNDAIDWRTVDWFTL